MHRCKFKNCTFQIETKSFLEYHLVNFHGRNRYKWCFFCGYTTKKQVSKILKE